MDDWEKSDVFQALNKLLQKEFCNLFRNEGIIFSSEFHDEDLVLVYSLPFDRNLIIQTRLSLLLGPFQIIFSLRRDNSLTDSLITDVKVSYELTFRLSCYNGKVIKEDFSSLIYDPESREIQMSESIFQVMKKMNSFLADSDDGNFHFCSGVASNKNLKVDQIFVECSSCSFQDDNAAVIHRSRLCSYLIESEILFSDKFFESLSTEKCRACTELESKVSGLDLLKQLPPGIAIASGKNRDNNSAKKAGGVVVIKNGATTISLPKVVRPTASSAKPSPVKSAPVRSFTTRKRTIEDIPVMTEADLHNLDPDEFEVKICLFYFPENYVSALWVSHGFIVCI